MDIRKNHKRLTVGLVGKESINLGDGTVESNDIEAVISSVQDQVHYGNLLSRVGPLAVLGPGS